MSKTNITNDELIINVNKLKEVINTKDINKIESFLKTIDHSGYIIDEAAVICDYITRTDDQEEINYNLKILNLFFAYGTSVNKVYKDIYENTPLTYAVYHEANIEFIQCLLDNNADVNFELNDGNRAIDFIGGEVRAYYDNVAELLIENSADFNRMNNYNESLLFKAIYKRNLELTTYLISKLDNFKILNNSNFKLLNKFVMVFVNDENLHDDYIFSNIKLMLEKGVDIEGDAGLYALNSAIRKNIELAKYLITNGVSYKYPPLGFDYPVSSEYYNPLYVATKHKQFEILDLFIDNKMEVGCLSLKALSKLTSELGETDVIEILKYFASKNNSIISFKENDIDYLRYTILEEKLQIADYVIANKYVDNYKTILDRAIKNDKPQVINYLIKKGKISDINSHGNSKSSQEILELAFEHDSPKVIFEFKTLYRELFNNIDYIKPLIGKKAISQYIYDNICTIAQSNKSYLEFNAFEKAIISAFNMRSTIQDIYKNIYKSKLSVNDFLDAEKHFEELAVKFSNLHDTLQLFPNSEDLFFNLLALDNVKEIAKYALIKPDEDSAEKMVQIKFFEEDEVIDPNINKKEAEPTEDTTSPNPNSDDFENHCSGKDEIE